LGVAGFIETQLFARRFTQVKDTPLGIRTTVIDAHDDRGSRLFTHNLELRSERERPVRTSKIILIKNFTASGLFPVKALAVITGIPRKSITDRSLLLHP